MATTKDKTKVHTIYKTTDNVRVPNVTTVLGILNKPALLDWAWKMGLEGQDYKLVRDNAATIGTIAHYLILCHLKGTIPELDQYSKEDIDKAENSLLSYFEWEKGHTIKPILVEAALVSDKYCFGGTIDCYAEIDGSPGLIDHKTGKGIYDEMLYQLSAYRQLLEEHGYPVDNCRILRIGRTEDENFEERFVGNGKLSTGWEIFKSCLDIYRNQKIMGKI